MHKWEYHVAKFYNEDPAGMEHGIVWVKAVGS